VFEEVLPTIRRTGGYLHEQAARQLVNQAVAQALPQLVSPAVAQAMPELGTQIVDRALPVIRQALLDGYSHHIFEANHGGASEEDQALLREIGRDAALEREAFMAEEPLELGAFLRKQLPADQQWKVACFALPAMPRLVLSRGTKRMGRALGWSNRRVPCASPTRSRTTSACCCSSGSQRPRSTWRVSPRAARARAPVRAGCAKALTTGRP
jgi:hypothetical protein